MISFPPCPCRLVRGRVRDDNGEPCYSRWTRSLPPTGGVLNALPEILQLQTHLGQTEINRSRAKSLISETALDRHVSRAHIGAITLDAGVITALLTNRPIRHGTAASRYPRVSHKTKRVLDVVLAAIWLGGTSSLRDVVDTGVWGHRPTRCCRRGRTAVLALEQTATGRAPIRPSREAHLL